MSTRTDIHRPSAINPEDYNFVAFDHIKIEGIGDCYYAQEQRRTIQKHQKATGAKYSGHSHGGNCMVCGNANAVYTALYHHIPTNVYVRVGQDCAEKMSFGNADWNAFRAAIKDARDLHAGKRKAQATLADANLTAAWDLYNSVEPRCNCDWSKPDVNGTLPYNTGFIYPEHPCTCPREGKEELAVRDIVGKLVRYGSVTEKTMNYVRTSLARIDNRAAIETQRAAEKALAADCPKGRVEVSGIVLTRKVQESQFGDTTKMLVKADQGFTVWTTVPSIGKFYGSLPEGYEGVQRGMRVHIKVTLEPAQNDSKHGFGSRPVFVEVPALAPAEVGA